MKLKKLDAVIAAIALIYWLFCDHAGVYLSIPVPLIAAGVSLGTKVLKGIFGKRKPQFTQEQKIARQRYLDMINNGGYQAGERGLLQQRLQQSLGADLGLQGALQNERLAGQGDTAFADSQRAQLAQNYANAVSRGMTNLDIAGQQRALAATQALEAMRPGEMSKGNFADVLGDVGDVVLPIAAQQLGAKGFGGNDGNKFLSDPSGELRHGLSDDPSNPFAKRSSIEFKENIEPVDPEAARQVLDNLNLTSFNYKPGIDDGGARRQVGLIAEQTPQPLATPDHRGIDISQLVMTMVGAMQSLSQEIDLVREFAKNVKDVRKVEKMYSIG